MFPNGEQIQVIRPEAVLDEYSRDVTSWSFDGVAPVTLTDTLGVPLVFAVAPRASSEAPENGRSPIYSGYVLYGPMNPDITPRDRVIVRGETYEVDGEVANWQSPYTGNPFGSVINLRRSEG